MSSDRSPFTVIIALVVGVVVGIFIRLLCAAFGVSGEFTAVLAVAAGGVTAVLLMRERRVR